MRYKVGDKVKIASFKEVERTYEIITSMENMSIKFNQNMEEDLNNLNTDRVLTIKEVRADRYYMEEIDYFWSDYMIEGLAKDYKEEIEEPILSRFDIIDL